MTAELLWKKRITLILSGVLSTALVGLFILYAYFLTGVRVVALDTSFYFLVSTSTHVQASTHEITQGGGAGYFFDWENKEYVAYAVYLNEADGQAVQTRVAALDQNVMLLGLYADKLYLKTSKEKRNAEIIKGAFTSLHGCIKVLNEEILRLLSNGTQESSKRVLEVLKKQFAYLKAEYTSTFPKFSALCEQAEKSLVLMLQEYVMVKNLRYLQCELSLSYIRLADNYSI